MITKGPDITGATIYQGFESNFHITWYTKRFLQDGNIVAISAPNFDW